MIETSEDDKTVKECVCDNCKVSCGVFNDINTREDYLDMVEILKSDGVTIIKDKRGVFRNFCSPNCTDGR